MEAQARELGAAFDIRAVEACALAGGTKRLTAGGEEFQARSVIIASGAKARRLGVPGEDEFIGRGVSYCATCDGAFFRGKRVAVVGGGDAAVDEGLFLTRFAEVVVVHRRSELRAAGVLRERAFKEPRMSFKWDSVVTAVQGEAQVNGLSLKNVRTGETETLPVDGVFVYIGHTPNTAFLQGEIRLDEGGYVVTDDELHTSVPGVLAAGDCRRKMLRQVATAVGDGAVAASSAEKYLAGLTDRDGGKKGVPR